MNDSSFRWLSKNNLEKPLMADTILSSFVLPYKYLSSPCKALCSAAWQRWESTHQPRSSLYLCNTLPRLSFNYRSACVFIYTLVRKNEVFCSPPYHLWIIHLSLLSFPLSLSVVSLIPCLLVACTFECRTLPSTLKMLGLPVREKSFLLATFLMRWSIYKIFLLPSICTTKIPCSLLIQKKSHLSRNKTCNTLGFCFDRGQLLIFLSS